ncbi:MAG: NAD(P)-dependent oxidoreductase [Chitinivibrionales bacterium]
MDTAFIGTGIMGSRMAMHLLRASHTLTVYNRSPDKCQPLVASGALKADTPAEAAKNCSVLFTMLSDPDAVRDTALGEHGFLSNMKQSAIWIDCSTVNPTFSRQMADMAGEVTVRFIDAPVTGSKIPAEKGELTAFAGGESHDIQEATPLLRSFCKTVNHIGLHGSGCSMIMVINLMLGHAMEAFSEALTLGDAMGIDHETLMETILSAPVCPPFIRGKKHKIEQEDYSPDFALQLMQKDLHLAMQTAYENEIALPTTAAVMQTYSLARQNGLGRMDYSAIYPFLAARAVQQTAASIT